MVLGLLDQLLIFSQLHLIELLRIAFNRSGATPAVALDRSNAFVRVWHLLHKLKFYGIPGQVFGFLSSFLSKKRFRVVRDGKTSQEYPVNAGVPQGFILGPTLFLLDIIDLPYLQYFYLC